MIEARPSPLVALATSITASKPLFSCLPSDSLSHFFTFVRQPGQRTRFGCGRQNSITRFCNNRNVLHLRVAHFQRVIDSANSQNVLAGMNVSKVILPIGSCHCLANKVEHLIRLHLEKRDSDSDKWARKPDDTSFQVGSTQYRGGHYEHFQEQNETQKLVAHREIK